MEKFHLPYVVIFIPTYNEEGSIGEIISLIKKSYQGSNQRDYVVDIIVIDSNSQDKTVKIARESGASHIIQEPIKRGLGAATRMGLQAALEMGADIAVKIDADMQNPPEEIEKVVRPILEDRADCVIGSRLMGELQYKMPFYRDFGNKFFAWLTSFITGLKVTDATTGLIACHKRYLQVFNIIKDYNETQQLIIDSWGKHMRVMEVSTIFNERKSGQSFIKFSFKYPSIVIPTMLRMYIHFKPLRFFFYTGITCLILGLLAALYLTFNQSAFFGDASVSILVIVGFQIIFFGLLADQISFKRK